MTRTKALKNGLYIDGSPSNDHPKKPNPEMILQPPGVVARLMGLEQIPSTAEEQVPWTKIIVLKPGIKRNLDLKAPMAEIELDGGSSKETAKEIIQVMRKTLGGGETLTVIKPARRKEGSRESSVIREAKKRLLERCSAAAARRGEDRRSMSTLAEILCLSEDEQRREKVSVRDKVSRLIFWKSRMSASSTPMISFSKEAPPSPENSGEEQDHPSPVSVLDAPFIDSPPLPPCSHLIFRSPQISSVSRIDFVDREDDIIRGKSPLISSAWFTMDPWKKMMEEEEIEMIVGDIEIEVLRELVLETVACISITR